MTTTKTTTWAEITASLLDRYNELIASGTTTCERGDSNPHALRRQILSPIATPHTGNGTGQGEAVGDRSAPEGARRVRPKVRQLGQYEVLVDDARFHHRSLVYGLVDAREPDRIRYVGKTTKSALGRYAQHILGARSGNGRKRTDWLTALLDAGHYPVMVLLERTNVGALDACELRWIRSMQAIGQADCNAVAPKPETQAKRDRAKFMRQPPATTDEFRAFAAEFCEREGPSPAHRQRDGGEQ